MSEKADSSAAGNPSSLGASDLTSTPTTQDAYSCCYQPPGPLPGGMSSIPFAPAAGGPTDFASGPESSLPGTGSPASGGNLTSNTGTDNSTPWGGPDNETMPIPDIRLEVYPSELEAQDGNTYAICAHLNLKCYPKEGLQTPAGYNYYREGQLVASTSNSIAYDPHVIPDITYSYNAKAFDENDVEYASSNTIHFKMPDLKDTSNVLKKVAICPVKFSDTETMHHTPEDYMDMFVNGEKSALSYFKEVSYGKVNFTAEVLPEVILDGNQAGYCSTQDEDGYGFNCDIQSLFSQSFAVLKEEHGVQEGDFDAIIYSINGMGQKGFNGGRSIAFSDHRLDVEVIVHEFGHFFGMAHGNDWTVPGDDIVGPSVINIYEGGCISTKHGDVLSQMGSQNLRHFRAINKLKVGWINKGAIQEINSAGTYEISALEAPANAPIMLKIRLTGVSEHIFYYLEYRKPIGFDADPISSQQAFHSGAQELGGMPIEVVQVYLRYDTVTGGTGTSWNSDAVLINTLLRPGVDFVDSLRGLTVSVVSFNPGNAATVQISGDF